MFHHVLLAHGRAVQELRASGRGGEIGIALSLAPHYPASDGPADVEVSHASDGYVNRWFLDPVLKGSYPDDMRRRYEEILGPLDFIRDGDLGHHRPGRRTFSASTTTPPRHAGGARSATVAVGDRRRPTTAAAPGGTGESPMTEAGTEILPAAFTDLLARLARLRRIPILDHARTAPSSASPSTTGGGSSHPRPPRRACATRSSRAPGRRLLPLVAPRQLRVGARLRAAVRARARRLRHVERGRSRTAAATTRASPARTRWWSRTREARRRRRRSTAPRPSSSTGSGGCTGSCRSTRWRSWTSTRAASTCWRATWRMLDRAGHPARLVATVSLDEAADGAAAVVLIQLRVGGQAARIVDELMPLACGCLGQEDDRLRRPREGAARTVPCSCSRSRSGCGSSRPTRGSSTSLTRSES